MRIPDDTTIRLVDLPPAVSGFVSDSPDGHHNVYININLSDAERRDAAEHEFRHIEGDDLYNDRDIHDVERDADGPKTRKLITLSGLISARQLMTARDLKRRIISPTLLQPVVVAPRNYLAEVEYWAEYEGIPREEPW